jgi:hypothetical protein
LVQAKKCHISKSNCEIQYAVQSFYCLAHSNLFLLPQPAQLGPGHPAGLLLHGRPSRPLPPDQAMAFTQPVSSASALLVSASCMQKRKTIKSVFAVFFLQVDVAVAAPMDFGCLLHRGFNHHDVSSLSPPLNGAPPYPVLSPSQNSRIQCCPSPSTASPPS